MPAEIEALQQEELAAEDLPLMEDGVIAEEDSSIPGEDEVGEGSAQVLEGSSGGESAQESMNETMEDMVSDIQGEALLEETDSIESPALEQETPLSSVGEALEPTIEQPLIQIPTEPSLSSDGNSSLH